MSNIIFAGSFDPAHIGHLNTYKKASRILNQEIKIGICYNVDKPEKAFTLKERIEIAKVTFPTSDIFSYESNNDIREMLIQSDLIIRGYRRACEENEKEYSLKLLQRFNISELINKIFYVEIDSEFEDVCSSNIKKLAQHSIELIKPFVTREAYDLIINKYGNAKI